MLALREKAAAFCAAFILPTNAGQSSERQARSLSVGRDEEREEEEEEEEEEEGVEAALLPLAIFPCLRAREAKKEEDVQDWQMAANSSTCFWARLISDWEWRTAAPPPAAAALAALPGRPL